MTSPTKKGLEKLRKEGYLAQVVEKFNMFAHVRQDLFGFIDLVAIKEDSNGVLGVQATSMTNVSSHIQKCLKSPALPIWLKAGNRFEVWGWEVKEVVGKRNQYRLRVDTFSMDGKSVSVTTSAKIDS